MPFEIRPTLVQDIPAITEIYADAVANGTASFELTVPGTSDILDRWQTLVGQGYPWLSLMEDEKLAGYAYAGPYRARPAYRWVVENSIYLDAAVRGKGQGKALLEALIAECTRLGFRQMIGVIGDSQNTGSIAVHKACGFRLAGTLKDMGWKHGRWLDTVYMQLALGEGGTRPADLESLPGKMLEIVKTK